MITRWFSDTQWRRCRRPTCLHHWHVGFERRANQIVWRWIQSDRPALVVFNSYLGWAETATPLPHRSFLRRTVLDIPLIASSHLLAPKFALAYMPELAP